jgi:hypothetical protein
MVFVSINATLNTTYIVGHTIFSTLYSVDKLDEQWMKNGKFCQYGWKLIEMDENMIDERMNP